MTSVYVFPQPLKNHNGSLCKQNNSRDSWAEV